MRQSSASASQVKAAPMERLSVGPVPAQFQRFLAATASLTSRMGDFGATSHSPGGAPTVARKPYLARSKRAADWPVIWPNAAPVPLESDSVRLSGGPW